jgi:hypothetical protein
MDTRRIRRGALAALSAVTVALVAAGPAAAESKTPAAPPAKKGCEVQLKGPGAGQSIVYPDGYSFSVQGQDSKTHTYTCNDGTWKETVTLTAGTWSTGLAVPIATYQVLTLAP